VVLGRHASESVAIDNVASFLFDTVLATVAGAVLAAHGQSVLGRKIGIKEAFGRARIGWVLLTWLTVAVILAIIWLGPVFLLHGFGVPLGFVLWIWLAIMLCLMFPVVVLERRNPIAAIRRSWRLVYGSYWRFLGIFLLFAILTVILFYVLGLFILVGAGAAIVVLHSHGQVSDGTKLALIIAGVVVYLVVSSLVTPLWLALLTLLYTDLRVRREGLDLVLQLRPAGQPLTGDEFASTAAPPPAWAPPPPAPPSAVAASGGQPPA
jgi:hypothetical protein